MSKKIEVVDVSEVIPKRPLSPEKYDGVSCLKITEETETARANYWPANLKATLKHHDDARFKSLKEVLNNGGEG